MAQKSNYQRQLNSDGSKNPKYVDLLEEDKPIAGQKFVCVSFVSPEKILKQKSIFYFEQFLKHWDFSKSTQKFTQFLNFMSFKYNLNFDDLLPRYTDFRLMEKLVRLFPEILPELLKYNRIQDETYSNLA